MRNLRDNRKQLVEEALNFSTLEVKELFIRLRWILRDIGQEEREFQKPYLIMLMDELLSTVTTYCETVQTLLSDRVNHYVSPNAFDILNEYCIYWNAYTTSIQEMSHSLVLLEDILNELWGDMFPDYPQFPRFSFWRVMVKVWIDQVFCPLGEVLEECFLKILKNRRVSLMQI